MLRRSISGIDDSKRLTARQREAQGDPVRRPGPAGSRGAARRLGVAPDFLLVDALRIPGLEVPQRGIVKGDAQSVSIAAASIVAKVSRDALMGEWDRRFPGYGLARNMGYGSAGQ